mmetsp:Transcript_94510/g.187288  ORF Transcript_94510/g.187288 Transcript_94510/m.187288 type:complete len:209 (+) Transcript_94510:2-628(+)
MSNSVISTVLSLHISRASIKAARPLVPPLGDVAPNTLFIKQATGAWIVHFCADVTKATLQRVESRHEDILRFPHEIATVCGCILAHSSELSSQGRSGGEIVHMDERAGWRKLLIVAPAHATQCQRHHSLLEAAKELLSDVSGTAMIFKGSKKEEIREQVLVTLIRLIPSMARGWHSAFTIHVNLSRQQALQLFEQSQSLFRHAVTDES